jgi:hypothetical protein
VPAHGRTFSIASTAVKAKRAALQPPSTKARGVPINSPPQRIVPNPPNVLGLVRELYSRMPETRTLEAYELRVTLWLLHYTDELLDEAEIAAAFEALRIEGEVLP